MTRMRLLASLLLIGLAGSSIGAMGAWFSDSGALRFEIEAADDFGGEEPAKVWVCKLVGPPGSTKVKEGKNPIHVSINSTDADQGFSDAHPSYIVENGDVVCVVPTPDEETTSEVVGRLLPDPTTTTSTTSTTTTTSTSTTTTSTTTTTTSTTPTTTTTIPETTTTTTGG
jgi:hypothetical protein